VWTATVTAATVGLMVWASVSARATAQAADRSAQGASGTAKTAAAGAAKAGAAGGAVARGKYLVDAGGCHDCHTPWKMGDNGPEPDMTLALSGHPASMTLPPPPAPSGPWVASSIATNTAWAGPWGISYTRNLTPHKENGLGEWTEEQFIDTMRTGRRQGRGREILPPMPWMAYRNLNDADLKAMFAYLRSVPPNDNKVPEPVINQAPPPSK
jgi:mono/diheme cytochrome c family protein